MKGAGVGMGEQEHVERDIGAVHILTMSRGDENIDTIHTIAMNQSRCSKIFKTSRY